MPRRLYAERRLLHPAVAQRAAVDRKAGIGPTKPAHSGKSLPALSIPATRVRAGGWAKSFAVPLPRGPVDTATIKLIHCPPSAEGRGYRQYRYLSAPQRKPLSGRIPAPGIDRKSIFPIVGEKARCRQASINFLFLPEPSTFSCVAAPRRNRPQEQTTTRRGKTQTRVLGGRVNVPADLSTCCTRGIFTSNER